MISLIKQEGKPKECSQSKQEKKPKISSQNKQEKKTKASSQKKQEKRAKRRVITLEQKLEVIRRYENSERTCDIARVTGLNEATLRSIRSNAENIKKSYATSTPMGAQRSNKIRPKVIQLMEKELVDWIIEEISKNSNISQLDIKAKALDLFENLKKAFPNESNLNFTASSGWLNRFKIRQRFEHVKFNGDNLSICSLPDLLSIDSFSWDNTKQQSESSDQQEEKPVSDSLCSQAQSLCKRKKSVASKPRVVNTYIVEVSSTDPRSLLKTCVEKVGELEKKLKTKNQTNKIEKPSEAQLNDALIRDILLTKKVKTNDQTKKIEKTSEVQSNDALVRDILLKNLTQIEESLGNLQQLDKKVKNSSVIIKKVLHSLKPYYDLFQKDDPFVTEANVSVELDYESNDESPNKKLKKILDSNDACEVILPV